MFHLDTLWTSVATGLQDYVAQGILSWITGLLSALLPHG
jgi:hypothetical protein